MSPLDWERTCGREAIQEGIIGIIQRSELSHSEWQITRVPILRMVFLFLVALIFCPASPADAAGIQLFNHGPMLSGAIWYPCQAEPKDVQLGELGVGVDYGLVGVKDCPITGAKLPLVIVSHGYIGWFGGHHDTAATLADAGFVVAAIDHPGDSAKDCSKSDDLSSFLSRPGDMVRLLDFLLQDWKHRAVIDPARIGLFGFSKGGYTGLALIGAAPDFARSARGFGWVKILRSTSKRQHWRTRAGYARPRRSDRRSDTWFLYAIQSGRDQDPNSVLASGGRHRGYRSGGHGAGRRRAAGNAGGPQRAGQPLCFSGAMLAGPHGRPASHLHRQAGGFRQGGVPSGI